jgi:endonuclease/exonuclease/phosphatase family metal-dependent hydrolase
MIRFRLVTYNVHKCKGIDLRVSPHRIADVIGEIKPEIIATQEILYSQATAIASDIGLPVTFGAARQHGGEPYGNAVFSSLPVLSSETHDLTARTREPRQCLRVSLAVTPRQPLHLFAVHLGTSFFERREQARRLISVDILERADLRGSRILAGDFNEWTRGLATRLAGERLRSADVAVHLKRRTTYPGLLPFVHLDHIYYDPVFHLSGMRLERTRLALLASDHLPLVADFEVGDGDRG